MGPDGIDYLSLADVIGLHGAIMRLMDAEPAPLRAEGALESAVLRPQMAAQYEQADRIRQAGLLAVGLWRAQAFVDGNKRVAYGALDVFLRRNGLRFEGHPLELARQLAAVASGADSLDVAAARLGQYLRDHVPENPQARR
jgi:death on curing protein